MIQHTILSEMSTNGKQVEMNSHKEGVKWKN